ncbi:hypothetical protein LOTGIDRAFT_234551 [Lottia gigantea]|uniref:Uncharacterized protein n=1 Tax=Lottia gigantea TaxID=225164 RepID=V4A5G5_LOTGI|nr:hypothetical protein LOTGIDRAFT_234551 [Lottia gigantea]ESO88496.1 hypothetical protein LOTGIDRAFT_234551 [Lottia gigantea]
MVYPTLLRMVNSHQARMLERSRRRKGPNKEGFMYRTRNYPIYIFWGVLACVLINFARDAYILQNNPPTGPIQRKSSIDLDKFKIVDSRTEEEKTEAAKELGL